MIKGFFRESIVKRAEEAGLVEIEIINLRDFAQDKYRTVDDKPYGGGAGMVLRADIVKEAIQSVIASGAKQSQNKIAASSTTPRNDEKKMILTSPRGKVFNQKIAQNYSKLDHLIIICGHYEGVDERISEYIDEEISIGDFVLTGGEIVAAAIVDSVVRLIPGVLKKKEASADESFINLQLDEVIKIIGADPVLTKLKSKGVKKITLLEYPQYTRPEEFESQKVPEVLLSGNHAEIFKWRIKKSLEETLKRRPDLLK